MMPQDAAVQEADGRRSVNKYRGRVWQSTLIDGVINHGTVGLKVKRVGDKPPRGTPPDAGQDRFSMATDDVFESIENGNGAN